MRVNPSFKDADPPVLETQPSAKLTSGKTTTVQVRYFASAKAAAGLDAETLSLPASSTVHDVLAALSGLHGEKLSRILTAASFLLNGVAVRDLFTPIVFTDPSLAGPTADKRAVIELDVL